MVGFPPGRPTIGSIIPGNQTAIIYFTKGSGTAPTDYQYSTDNGTTYTSMGTTSSPFTVSGLTNGLTYQVKITASNSNGTSDPSTATNVTPYTVPDAPTITSGIGGDEIITVNFIDGSSGGSVIINHEYSTDNGDNYTPCSPAVTTSPITITGRVNGQVYGVNIRAINAAGSSDSSNTVEVTPQAPAPPSAPTGLSATPNNESAIISFTAPATGAPILDYKYALSTDSYGIWYLIGTNTSPVTVNGLTNNVAISIKLLAVNASGDGTPSAAVTVTPVAGTIPNPPTGLSGSAGVNQVTISFTPGSDGGSVITNYQYATSTDGTSYSSYTAFFPATEAASSVTITGLTNGQAYYFKLKSVNANGVSATASSAVGPLTPAAIAPSPPTSLSIGSVGNQQLTINFTPESNGGSAITNYQYATSTDGTTYSSYTAFSPATGAVSTVTVTGLTNGTAYYVKLKAVNAVGTGSASAGVGPGTPLTTPSAPTITSISPSNQGATVYFTPPADTGGSAITNYYYSLDGGPYTNTLNVPFESSFGTITGLTNGVSYAVTIKAANVQGKGTASNSVNVIPNVTPDAPTNLTATPGNTTVLLSYIAPSGTITNYQYSSDNGTNWTSIGVVTSYTVTGLTNGTTYTFIVRAQNAIGYGAATSPVTVTPATTPSAPTSLITSRGGSGILIITFTAGSTGGTAITNYQYATSTDGYTTYTSVTSFTTTTATIAGLTNGTSYTFKLRAVNTVGNGAVSAATGPTIPAAVPSAPTNLVFVSADQALIINFTPGNNEGSPITNYNYAISLDGGGSYSTYFPFSPPTGPVSSITITGLDNGFLYYVKIKATNSLGDGGESQPVSGTPRQRPNPPTITDFAINGQTVAFSFIPGYDGGAQITNYTFSLDGITFTPFAPPQTTSPLILRSLPQGVSYNFQFQAVSIAGAGTPSTNLSIFVPITPPQYNPDEIITGDISSSVTNRAIRKSQACSVTAAIARARLIAPCESCPPPRYSGTGGVSESDRLLKETNDCAIITASKANIIANQTLRGVPESVRTAKIGANTILCSFSPTDPNSRFVQYQGRFIPPACPPPSAEQLNSTLPKPTETCVAQIPSYLRPSH